MNFIDRLNDEAIDLASKLKKLREFRVTDRFDELSRAHQTLLTKQEKAMQEYLDVLDIRLELLRGY